MPALRARLMELVKAQVRQVDQRNLGTGRADDINAHIRELGLAEIDFPPPPPRRPVANDAPVDEEFDDEFDDDYYDAPELALHHSSAAAGGWSAPPLGKRPLTSDEAIERIQAGLDAFETAADAIAEITASGSTLLEDALALAEGQLDEQDVGHLNAFLIQIWFALVPRGGRAPALRFEAMADAFDRDSEKLRKGGPGSLEVLQQMLADSPQPHLLQVVAAAIVGSIEKGPKASRPKPGSVVGMLLVVKAMIAEIDHARRGP